MRLTGMLINYYIHCPRQCYLHAKRFNLEDNSELVKIGKALHSEGEDTEVMVENIKVDKITAKFVIEVKKK